MKAAIHVLIMVILLPALSSAQDSWEHIGLNNHNVISLTFNSKGHIFAGTVEGTIFYSFDDGDNWKESFRTGYDMGEAHSLIVNSEGAIFVGFAYGSPDSKGMYYSDDMQMWTGVGMRGHNVYCLDINSNGHIFAGTESGVYRSADNGGHWDSLEDIGLTQRNVISLTLNSKGHIFAGTVEGTIFYSFDDGDNWKESFRTGYDMGEAHSLIVNSEGAIFVGFAYGSPDSKGMYYSDDMQMWTGVGMRGHNVYCLDINSNGHIFAGTESGVYRSADNGGHWVPFNTGLNKEEVYCIGIDSQEYIFIGTNNGIYRSTQSTTSVEEMSIKLPMAFKLGQNTPNPFNPSTTIRFDLPESSEISLKVYTLLGEEVETLISQNLSAGEHQVDWNAGNLPGGIYLVRLQAGGFVQTRKMILTK